MSVTMLPATYLVYMSQIWCNKVVYRVLIMYCVDLAVNAPVKSSGVVC